MEANPGKKMAFGNPKRKAVNLAQPGLIVSEEPSLGATLPLLILPSAKGVDLVAWAEASRGFLEEKLLAYGAILFRHFDISQVEEFERFIVAACGEILEYRYRASPRSQVSGNIYTSTDYPADQSIFPHNEHGYSPVFPRKIFFFCSEPPEQGGETPIGSCRNILRRISPRVREKFCAKGVMYVRNFGDGFGLPWQTVFQTDDRRGVEEYCSSKGIECEWKDGNRLRTREVGPAMVHHPHTGEDLWFNHATFFHVSTLPPQVRDSLLKEFKYEDLPTNTYYGDGSDIEPEVLEELREAYRQEMVAFPWQKGDLLMLDNMLTVHARNPYSGSRRVLVGMAESRSRNGQ